MRVVRVAIRLVLFVAFTAWICLWVGGGARLARLFSPSGERAAGAWRARGLQAWARGLLRILGVRTEVQGTPPEPPFFLVSNHLSYLDIAVLGAHFPCVFVAKAEVAAWPAFGSVCRVGDTIFVDRDNKRDIPRALAEVRRVLDSGRGVVVFPEGSSTRGAEVLRFRPALLETAARAAIPVSYATLSYGTPPGGPPAHLAVCWWGEMPFASHFLALLGLSGIRASLKFGDERIVERDRKVLADRLFQAVRGQFQPVVGTEIA